MNGSSGTVHTEAEAGLLSNFSEIADTLPGAAEFARERREAMSRFSHAGLPTRRMEAWKYTDLRRLLDEAVPVAAPASQEASRAAALAGTPLADVERCRLVVVNGRFMAGLSDLDRLPEGITALSLAEALACGDARWRAAVVKAARGLEGDAAVQLNTAFVADGVLLDVAENAKPDRPIEIVHHFLGRAKGAATLRNVMRIGAGAEVEIVESYLGSSAAYQTNALSFLDIGAAARCGYVRLQTEGAAALHLGTVTACLEAGAQMRMFSLMAGAATARMQAFVTLQGAQSDADIRGATLAHRRQHEDMTITVDHTVPDCVSRETFKSVADDEARAVFQGRIVVRPQAQHTDARMMTNGLLLSPGAEFDAKPELEIYADDVQCAHGATSGAVDEDMLFYLMARGIPRDAAETLLIAAFLGEAIEGIANHRIADAVRSHVEGWLKRERTA